MYHSVAESIMGAAQDRRYGSKLSANLKENNSSCSVVPEVPKRDSLTPSVATIVPQE